MLDPDASQGALATWRCSRKRREPCQTKAGSPGLMGSAWESFSFFIRKHPARPHREVALPIRSRDAMRGQVPPPVTDQGVNEEATNYCLQPDESLDRRINKAESP